MVSCHYRHSPTAIATQLFFPNVASPTTGICIVGHVERVLLPTPSACCDDCVILGDCCHIPCFTRLISAGLLDKLHELDLLGLDR